MRFGEASPEIAAKVDLTALLQAWREGDGHAFSTAIERVYAELKRMAVQRIGGRSEATLSPTELVHEAVIGMMPTPMDFANRAHFLATAARSMRQILVDQARARSADKRGGAWVRTQLTDRIEASAGDPVDLLALDAALTRLQALDGELAEIVEAYFFAGFTFEEIAEIRQIGERSQKFYCLDCILNCL